MRNDILDEATQLVIAQSTLDLIGGLIEERKGKAKNGSLSVGKEAGQFFRNEQPPEEVQRNVEFLEGFFQWVQSSSTVMPVMVILERGRRYRKRLTDIMDDAFVDTILLASEAGRLLYSDDLVLRALAKAEFGTDGIWTQVLLEHGRRRHSISERQYMEGTVRLSHGNYRHTFVNSSLIVEAARASSWRPVPPLKDALMNLEGGRCDDSSAIRVVADVVYRLWLEPILDYQRSFVFDALLNTLITKRRTEVINAFAHEIRRRFALMPLQEIEVGLLLKTWIRERQSTIDYR
jgi:hypothetical protein